MTNEEQVQQAIHEIELALTKAIQAWGNDGVGRMGATLLAVTTLNSIGVKLMDAYSISCTIDVGGDNATSH